MVNWFHKLLHPHCPECREDAREELVCPSCEMLQTEVARLRHDNERLLNRLIEKPENNDRNEAPVPSAPLPHRLPWKARAAQLEAQDREKAQEMKLRAAAPKTDVTDLEKELDVVTQEREGKGGT